jgi:hypothetical protein
MIDMMMMMGNDEEHNGEEERKEEGSCTSSTEEEEEEEDQKIVPGNEVEVKVLADINGASNLSDSDKEILKRVVFGGGGGGAAEKDVMGPFFQVLNGYASKVPLVELYLVQIVHLFYLLDAYRG